MVTCVKERQEIADAVTNVKTETYINPDYSGGLYTPELESDACGIGLITHIKGEKSHRLIDNALTMLERMEHRGATGAEANTGDGSGISLQLPHSFFQGLTQRKQIELPEFGHYGVATVFYPQDDALFQRCKILMNDIMDELDLEPLMYRKVPTDRSGIGATALSVEPKQYHILIKPKDDISFVDLERRLYVFRKYVIHHIHQLYPNAIDSFYVPSCSYKTIIYKGQLTTFQLRTYYPDLQNDALKSAIAIVHSRFSTNTVPKWKLAQPFRVVAHNGEINTIQGNKHWWEAREAILKSDIFTPDEMEKIYPVIGTELSDSGSFDNVLEFLVMAGYSLPHALMMMIPQAWQHDEQMDDELKAFYNYHQHLMEPWDGPAAMCFTDGKLVGARVDRNGLRPARYLQTKDDFLVVSSEVGVFDVAPENIKHNGRLQPGRLLIADLEKGELLRDREIKAQMAKQEPYGEWLTKHQLHIDAVTANDFTGSVEFDDQTLVQKSLLFGMDREAINYIVKPMANQGKYPVSSMGTDTPLAILSQKPQHLSHYFKQLFAQVTNPPIDPIRERHVMSLHMLLGGAQNILQPGAEHCQFIQLDSPVLNVDNFFKLYNNTLPQFKVGNLQVLFRADGQPGRLQAALNTLCSSAEALVRSGCNILNLTDRTNNFNSTPIPSLLAVGAVHQHLLKQGLRSQTSLMVCAGDVWEGHHFATLIGYGANAVYPYMAYAAITKEFRAGQLSNVNSIEEGNENYQKAIETELLKIISKIGVSTLQSYHGSQIFEVLGLADEVVEQCFNGSVSRIGGIGFAGIATECLTRYGLAFAEKIPKVLPTVGRVQWKRDGEQHLFNPKTIHHLQHAVRRGDSDSYRKYAEAINAEVEHPVTLRQLLDLRKGDSIDIAEVEPVQNILKRFATGAMSFGSISYEAHTTLAIAMNRIGGKSNSGEGGEDPIRYELTPEGDNLNSAIKQVASGRFGVTAEYLSNAVELQIKMAQGAKPGEGGQLPGHKVNDWIARVRLSTPGVGLISPPPHHDIYSIEDLAQLIFDLKNSNPKARINVKLVSKCGVGVIASGVAKAHADVILISGHDGGTGASPLTSIQHAGLPWELGLAETHQTLLKNQLRDRVTIQADGQIRTGKDIAIATLLGAEEWGVASAALVAEGCIMMRKCHLNTCPVGIATQDPELRKRFAGKVEHVVNFFHFLAEELREIMASLGFRTVNEMVGKVEMLKVRSGLKHWKHKSIDMSRILYWSEHSETVGQYKQLEQDHAIDNVLDRKLIRQLQSGASEIETEIVNTDRAVGAMLSNYVVTLPKHERPHNFKVNFKGFAGQSFGVFLNHGINFDLTGQANDYFGKGLSGGSISVKPYASSDFEAAKNIIIGNVAFYGATSGQAFIAGRAGERFCVRNSGAEVVVEGIGDNGCEYMTGGIAVIIGDIGKNFAAGMSGGLAYIHDADASLETKTNMDGISLERLDSADVERVKAMLEEHVARTQSVRAKALLKNWSEVSKQFTKVFPLEYKRALSEMAEQQKKVA
ncbi:MAG: glutamate synthase large subunit [Granulosicoccus sp.]|nr:glutamate synthase large subunit [Granulosicoccus sp.]